MSTRYPTCDRMCAHQQSNALVLISRCVLKVDLSRGASTQMLCVCYRSSGSPGAALYGVHDPPLPAGRRCRPVTRKAGKLRVTPADPEFGHDGDKLLPFLARIPWAT